MRVLISVDLEGIASVVSYAEGRLEGIEYERTRRLMTAEANAAIEGALAAGATEVVVNDSHGHMRNLLPEELHKQARLIRGNIKPLGMMQGLTPETRAVFMIGYHAKAGTACGILNHTYVGSVLHALRINGEEYGESGFNAAMAGAMGVPVALVTGDEALSQEVATTLPWAERVIVKYGVTAVAAENVSPALAREMIRQAAEKAIARLPEMKPLVLSSPIRLELEFYRPIFAELAMMIPGTQRVGGRTVAYEAPDALAAYRGWTAIEMAATTDVGLRG